MGLTLLFQSSSDDESEARRRRRSRGTPSGEGPSRVRSQNGTARDQGSSQPRTDTSSHARPQVDPGTNFNLDTLY